MNSVKSPPSVGITCEMGGGVPPGLECEDLRKRGRVKYKITGFRGGRGEATSPEGRCAQGPALAAFLWAEPPPPRRAPSAPRDVALLLGAAESALPALLCTWEPFSYSKEVPLCLFLPLGAQPLPPRGPLTARLLF